MKIFMSDEVSWQRLQPNNIDCLFHMKHKIQTMVKIYYVFNHKRGLYGENDIH